MTTKEKGVIFTSINPDTGAKERHWIRGLDALTLDAGTWLTIDTGRLMAYSVFTDLHDGVVKLDLSLPFIETNWIGDPLQTHGEYRPVTQDPILTRIVPGEIGVPIDYNWVQISGTNAAWLDLLLYPNAHLWEGYMLGMTRPWPAETATGLVFCTQPFVSATTHSVSNVCFYYLNHNAGDFVGVVARSPNCTADTEYYALGLKFTTAGIVQLCLYRRQGVSFTSLQDSAPFTTQTADPIKDVEIHLWLSDVVYNGNPAVKLICKVLSRAGATLAQFTHYDTAANRLSAANCYGGLRLTLTSYDADVMENYLSHFWYVHID